MKKLNNINIFYLVVSHLIIISCNEPSPPSSSVPCALDMEAAIANYDNLINDDDPSNDPDQPPRKCEIPQREPAANMMVHVELTDFDELQETKMRDALERAKIILNSAEFKKRVLNHTYGGQRTFANNNGQTNEEIYETIMAGKEVLIPEVDEEMDLDMTLYYKNNSTVGYTYPDTIRIWVNDKFFRNYTPGQVAANAVHEWTHKLGYGHSFRNTPERPYSVPYGIGKIIEDMVDGM